MPSTHGLIGEFGIVAAKSGHTDAAGYNLAFRSDAGDAPVVGVILGAPSVAQRDLDAGRLISGIAR
ncbi:hypothetical protein [Microbacterium sp. CIAB417]|uniref:hypothetical protein n=1 Tax=Microbacterium sp. CIAB417 TaxID=2860287 RepID=UPI001FAC38D1|nr:hypothetical protein [Microbacterium sp. CIAB417]